MISPIVAYTLSESGIWHMLSNPSMEVDTDKPTTWPINIEGKAAWAIKTSSGHIADCKNGWRHWALQNAAQPDVPSIDTTLAERGYRYGTFTNHAFITQNIKDAIRNSPNWEALASDQKECLEMLAHKMGRILNGDPNYHDSWHDMVGYAKLVADRLLGIIK